MHSKANILIVGSDDQSSLERMYKRAFESLGCKNVAILNLKLINPISLKNRILKRVTLPLQNWNAGYLLREHLKVVNRSYDLIIVFKGMALSRKALEAARSFSRNSIWININPDDPFNIQSRGFSNQNVMDCLSFYDVYCIWAKGLVQKLLTHGCKSVLHLPFGFDTDYHQPEKNRFSPQKDLAISFVGTWDKERENTMKQISEFDLKIYGNHWNRISRKSILKTKDIEARNIFGQELQSVMSRSLVSINMLRPQNFNYHNMRTFEIPAMRTFMLSTRSDEQLDFFKEGIEAEYYSSCEELKDKLRFYLCNQSKIESIAKAGYERCMESGYSYNERARFLLDQILP